MRILHSASSALSVVFSFALWFVMASGQVAKSARADRLFVRVVEVGWAETDIGEFKSVSGKNTQ